MLRHQPEEARTRHGSGGRKLGFGHVTAKTTFQQKPPWPLAEIAAFLTIEESQPVFTLQPVGVRVDLAGRAAQQFGDGGDGASFSVRTTAFNDVPIFMARSGSYEITAVPLKGGLVEGTFTAICDNVKDDGTTETYTFSGSFKLPRR